ncbi:MAG TPA: mycofactocin biosynthesis peptidyl-dipeptidase MftE [Pseudonocardia sp.]
MNGGRGAAPRHRELGTVRWPEVATRATTLVVPVGSCEQHGPHLPLDTDTRIASAVASGAVRLRGGAGENSGAGKSSGADWNGGADGNGGSDRTGADVLLAPAVAFGASGEHEMFPGTVSVGQDALRSVLVELGRSAGRWSSRIVFVNGHGGNVGVLREAVDLLRAEGRDARWWGCALPADAGFVRDGHAGRTETSIMLALAPETVLLERAAAGNSAPLAELLPAMRAGGVRAVSDNGVLGDPAGASAEEGRRMLEVMTAACARAVGAEPAVCDPRASPK